MGIVDDDVARVREATDLVALAGEHLALKHSGRRFVGLCPFHPEKTPSFSINQEHGFYYCFGCAASGDAITFVREVEHLDFVGAVERLAARAGIQLRYDDAAYSQDRKRRDRLHAAVAAAIDFYHDRLMTHEDAGLARRYLRSRSLREGSGAAVQARLLARRLRRAEPPPRGAEVLARRHHRRRASRSSTRRIGCRTRSAAASCSRSTTRAATRPGSVARSLDGVPPKYKNTQETPIYQKSRLLYGLNWAKPEIVARGEVVICEGYTDVMAFVLAGVPNVVATCGTALADEHFTMLKNFARKVTLAYDADAAGRAAAETLLPVGAEVRGAVPGRRPPARTRPRRPLARSSAPALVAAVERAAPFLEFRVDRLLEAGDLSSIEGRRARGRRRGRARRRASRTSWCATSTS